jgi:DNA-binding NtrC family response regulator
VQKLLVIDDEPSICQILMQSLTEQFDANVECALSAPDGANRLQATHFDFVLIDVMLTGGSGIEVAAIAANENTPVLLTSGHPEVQLQLKQFRFPFLRKPFSLAALSIQAAQIMSEASDNIRQVKAATARLEVNLDALNAAMAQSRRLLAASHAIVRASLYSSLPRVEPGAMQDCLHD